MENYGHTCPDPSSPNCGVSHKSTFRNSRFAGIELFPVRLDGSGPASWGDNFHKITHLLRWKARGVAALLDWKCGDQAAEKR